MGILINGKQYANATDANSNSVWDANEVNRASGTDALPANYDLLSMASLAELMNAANFTQGNTWTLEQLLGHAGDVETGFSDDAKTLDEQIAKDMKKLEVMDNASNELKTKIASTKQQITDLLKGRKEGDLSPKELKDLEGLKDQLTLLENAKDHTEKVLSELLAKLKDSVAQAEKDNDGLEKGTYKDMQGNEQQLDAKKLSALKNAFQALKQRLGEVSAKYGDALAKKTPSGGTKAAASGGAADAGDGGTPAGGRAAAPYGGGPFGQMRAGASGFPPLDMNALLMSNYTQQSSLETTDAMHKSENESKRMMLLFFMLARMAMSGDIGAMYQFLRFIGHIVNKDKAMQNVQLARKLIELQDVSRKLTQMLVDTPAYDEGDQGVQAEYMKMQQKVQAEQGVIATSQKLISQMLEEFTQVSEMMTGMVKSLLDARGRELSMLAVWRA